MVKFCPMSFGVKSTVIAAIFFYCESWTTAIFVAMTVTLSYRHVIAVLLGLDVMPILEVGTYLSDDKAPLNIMSSILFSKEMTIDKLDSIYRKVIHRHPKMI